MNTQEFEEYFQKWRDRIVRMARRIAHGDMDLADDLAQEAFWKLAELDLDCVTENEDGCIWRVARDHMINVRNREMRARVIVPMAVTRWGRGKRNGTIVYVRSDSGKRSRVSGPRHLNAAPMDEEREDNLWDDL